MKTVSRMTLRPLSGPLRGLGGYAVYSPSLRFPWLAAKVSIFQKISFKWQYVGIAPIALSYREIEALMLERGVLVDHATLNRWVEKYSPLLGIMWKNGQKSGFQCLSSFPKIWLCQKTVLFSKKPIFISGFNGLLS